MHLLEFFCLSTFPSCLSTLLDFPNSWKSSKNTTIFDCQNFCKTKIETTKIFKNQLWFLSKNLLTVIFEIFNICRKSWSIKWSQWSNLGHFKVENFWLLTKNGHFRQSKIMLKETGIFVLFFTRGGRKIAKFDQTSKALPECNALLDSNFRFRLFAVLDWQI